jgi:excisionase family DNA binding protein
VIFNDLPDKTLLRVDEVAGFFSVTERTVYRWCEEGSLESTLINGKLLRILRQSVLKMVEAGKDYQMQPSVPDISPKKRKVLSKGI